MTGVVAGGALFRKREFAAHWFENLSHKGERTLTCPRTLPAVLTWVAVVLTAAAALAQELAIAPREAFTAITRAGKGIDRARDTEALLRAAEQAVPAAARAFAAADRARDAAAAGYRAAYREALAGAVTCDNRLPVHKRQNRSLRRRDNRLRVAFRIDRRGLGCQRDLCRRGRCNPRSGCRRDTSSSFVGDGGPGGGGKCSACSRRRGEVD